MASRLSDPTVVAAIYARLLRLHAAIYRGDLEAAKEQVSDLVSMFETQENYDAQD